MSSNLQSTLGATDCEEKDAKGHAVVDLTNDSECDSDSDSSAAVDFVANDSEISDDGDDEPSDAESLGSQDSWSEEEEFVTESGVKKQ